MESKNPLALLKLDQLNPIHTLIFKLFKTHHETLKDQTNLKGGKAVFFSFPERLI